MMSFRAGPQLPFSPAPQLRSRCDTQNPVDYRALLIESPLGVNIGVELPALHALILCDMEPATEPELLVPSRSTLEDGGALYGARRSISRQRDRRCRHTLAGNRGQPRRASARSALPRNQT